MDKGTVAHPGSKPPDVPSDQHSPFRLASHNSEGFQALTPAVGPNPRQFARAILARSNPPPLDWGDLQTKGVVERIVLARLCFY